MKDRSFVFQLRKEGKSYGEISKISGVSKSTLSDWLRNEDFSIELKNKIIRKSILKSTQNLQKVNAKRRTYFAKQYRDARIEAKREFLSLKDNPLFVAGVSIYWGEGDRASKNGFRIGNIDPRMIRTFKKFLLKICKVDKKRIRAWILMYPDLEESTCLDYWKKEADLKDTVFTKSIRIKGKSKLKKLTYGVCYLSYSSRYLKEKVLTWVDLLAKV